METHDMMDLAAVKETGKSELEEGIKMKDGKHPNPNTIHPIAGYVVLSLDVVIHGL